MPNSPHPLLSHPQEEGWSPLLYADFNANEECVLALMSESPEQLFGLLEKMENAQDKVCTPSQPLSRWAVSSNETPNFTCWLCFPPLNQLPQISSDKLDNQLRTIVSGTHISFCLTKPGACGRGPQSNIIVLLLQLSPYSTRNDRVILSLHQ